MLRKKGMLRKTKAKEMRRDDGSLWPRSLQKIVCRRGRRLWEPKIQTRRDAMMAHYGPWSLKEIVCRRGRRLWEPKISEKKNRRWDKIAQAGHALGPSSVHYLYWSQRIRTHTNITYPHGQRHHCQNPHWSQSIRTQVDPSACH